MIASCAVSTAVRPILRPRAFRRHSRCLHTVQAAKMSDAEVSKLIADNLRGIPDFPKPGILFWDVTTLLLDPKVFQATIDAFTKRYADKKVDVVAGFEARGLIFGAPLALALNCAFVPLRKPGKLPGQTISEAYDLEYGSDKIEMHVGHIKEGHRVVLLDDLIATGGTMGAGIKLMEKVGAEVVECGCIIELPELKGREKLGKYELHVLAEKEGL
eukprot:jgi/Ulvmu1/9313/UM050_0062.1